MTSLTKKDQPFRWGEKEQEAFEKLKVCLSNPPLLAYYDPNLPIEVRTDASDIGLGCVVVQQHQVKGKKRTVWKPIAYGSRKLLDREKNYGTSEKECLAIIFALEKFRQYLEGHKFTVVTDHSALSILTKKASNPPRLTRWALLLQDFEFEVKYEKESFHSDADALSRNIQENLEEFES